MNVVTALKEIFNPANGYENFLPEGKDGDGVSKQHFQGARKKVELLIEEYKKLQIASRKSAKNLQDVALKETHLRFASELSKAFVGFETKLEAEMKMGAKLNRWLGYFQSLIVTNGGASLDEMKLINKNSWKGGIVGALLQLLFFLEKIIIYF